MTEAHHLEALAARGSKTAADLLEGPEFPDALEYLWNWFMELDFARSTSAAEGLGPITYEQVDAWCRVTRREVELNELEAFFLLDRAIRFPPKHGG